MPERLSGLEMWKQNLKTVKSFWPIQEEVRQLLAADNITDALGVVSREAGIITQPSLFYLGNSQWVNGFCLGEGELRLSIGTGMTRRMTTSKVVFLSTGQFCFYESVKEVTGFVEEGKKVTGLEMQEQKPEGHRIFFKEGTLRQQKMLISETFQAILSSELIRILKTG